MLIAKEKEKSNIAEYILYMWQIEDLIRSYNFAPERLLRDILEGYNQPDQVKNDIKDWYLNIIRLMKEEGIEKAGHLSFINSTLDKVNDLHLQFLEDENDKQYQDVFMHAKPNIDELSRKAPGKFRNDIEACLTGLYGLLLLRLQKKTVTVETAEALSTIRDLIALLVSKYHQDDDGELVS